jgi:hypothetical protein
MLNGIFSAAVRNCVAIGNTGWFFGKKLIKRAFRAKYRRDLIFMFRDHMLRWDVL